MASAHMQRIYKEQLKNHAMYPMYSRYGRETKNYHNEFMKVHSQVKQSKLEECHRTQPKVNTNRNLTGPKQQGQKTRQPDSVKEMVELNMRKLMQN